MSVTQLLTSYFCATCGCMGILNAFPQALSCTFLLFLQFVCCHAENEIRVSPSFEVTRDTDDPPTCGSWNQKTKTTNCNCHDQHGSMLSLFMCRHLYWPAVSKSCVPRCQKHTWESSSMHTNVFGLLCVKRFMLGVETHVKSPQKLMGIPSDQALFYNYCVSSTNCSFLFPKNAKNSPKVNVVALRNTGPRKRTSCFVCRRVKLVNNSLNRKAKVCVGSAGFWSFHG